MELCCVRAASDTMNSLPRATFWDPYRSFLLKPLTQMPEKSTLLLSDPCSCCPVPSLSTAGGGYVACQPKLASHWELNLQSSIPLQGKLPCPQQPMATQIININMTSSGSKDHKHWHTLQWKHRPRISTRPPAAARSIDIHADTQSNVVYSQKVETSLVAMARSQKQTVECLYQTDTTTY